MSKQPIKNALKLLKLLQKNTDKNHPITQSSMRELFGDDASEIMGDKGTFARRLREIADALNTDESGDALPEDDWRIVYPGYGKDGGKNGKIYYNPVFTDTEMDFFIKQIRETSSFTEEEKKSMEQRLVDNLCSDYYQYQDNPREHILDRDKAMPGENVTKNIAILRDNIKAGHMVEFYDTVFESGEKLRVSPYLLIHQEGHYWLIGNCHERKPMAGENRKVNTYTDALTSYRVDLISDINTAHTPSETYVHWAMTHNALRAHSYTRINMGNRKTKARNTEIIRKKLETVINSADKYEHGKDIV